jgi:hypothetical protein
MNTKRKSVWAKTTLTGLIAAVFLLGLTTGSVLAVEVSEEDYKTLQTQKAKEAEKQLPPHERPPPSRAPANAKAGNLAEAATNPIAPMIQFQLQDVYNWENHNSDGYGNNFVIQPVIPIALPWEKVPMMITRTTIPYVSTPDLGSPVNRKHGFGDTVVLGLLTPKLKTKGVQLGLGGTFTIPTAGDNDFTGSGKWQAGPAFLYINMKTPQLQWGLFAFQSWSFASTSGSREDVSKLSLQPFITKHFGKGWYVGSPDSPQTYDFKADEWTWALGAQLGHVTKLGKMPVKLFVEPLYNPNNDAGPTAEWTLKLNITLLFPE